MNVEEEIHSSIRTFEQLRKDKASLLSSPVILLRCRDEEIIPTFAQVWSSVKSPAAQQILRRTSLASVREQIHKKQRSLDTIDKKLLDLHLRLVATLSLLDWEYIDHATAASGDLLLKKNTERQKKFSRLPSSKKTIRTNDDMRLVINMTDLTIDKPTISVLSKGLNFAPAPRSIPYSGLVGSIEQAIRKLPEEAAEEARTEISVVLKRALPPKSNIRKEERDAIRALRANRNDTLRLLAEKFDADMVQLFHHVLTSTYFQYHGEFYEQSDGVAMGSHLSPAIANFFVEDFEEKALSSAPLKPLLFLQYVDDTFVTVQQLPFSSKVTPDGKMEYAVSTAQHRWAETDKRAAGIFRPVKCYPAVREKRQSSYAPIAGGPSGMVLN
ncbi:uncharacterized protein LOC124162253 [Ischnura elegans]|uniref:uncharacterized protein LOC124162253 n=1 Tax=Ischnura elegans TaxID=197161 RepID=UPI001ED8AAAF|nr:uncharacterized protein LOC124162253 [Ischnura elegans]